MVTIFPQPLAIDHQIMVCSQIRASGRTLTDWCFGQDQAGKQIEKFRRTREVLFGVALQNRARALRLARRPGQRPAPARVRGSEATVTALP